MKLQNNKQPLLSFGVYDRQSNSRLRTEYRRTEGKYVVKKIATNSDAIEHLERLHRNHKIIKSAYPSINLPEISKVTGESLNMEYIPHPTLYSLIEQSLIKGELDNIIKILNRYLKFIDDFETKGLDENNSRDFYNWLDPHNRIGWSSSTRFLDPAILDMNLDNLLFDSEKIILIDYEYVYQIPFDVDYLKYRPIYYLAYFMQRLIYDFRKSYKLVELWKGFYIPEEWCIVTGFDHKILRKVLIFEYNFLGYKVQIPEILV